MVEDEDREWPSFEHFLLGAIVCFAAWGVVVTVIVAVRGLM